MSQICPNASFEEGAAPGTNWSTNQAALSYTNSFNSTTFIAGTRSLQQDLSINGVNQAGQVFQFITGGFAVGDKLSIMVHRRVTAKSIANGYAAFSITAIGSNGAVLASLYSSLATAVDSDWVQLTGETQAIPENTASIGVTFRVDGTSSTTGSMTVLWDYVMIDVIPQNDTTLSPGIIAAGQTHDVALEWDSGIGPVGFSILRDDDNRMAYFEEEAPVFGDPKTQSDSSASDFTMWRSANQVIFSDGMGQVDFNIDDGTKKFLLLENGRLSDTGFIARGPAITTEVVPGLISSSLTPPFAKFLTNYNNSLERIRFVAFGNNLLYSVPSTGTGWTHCGGSPFGPQITDAVAFKRRVLAGFGNSGDMIINSVVGGVAFISVVGEEAGFYGSGEGNLIRIKPDANGVVDTLELSTDMAIWSATKTYDDGVANATGSMSPGFFQGLFYFGARDGLYSWDGGTSGSSTALVLSFSTAASANNAKRIKLFKGRLYFTIGSDVLYEFDGATAPRRITEPWSAEIIAPSGGIYEGTVQWLDIEPTAYKLYVAVACTDNSAQKYTLVMSYDGTAWVVEYKHTGAHLMLGSFDAENRIYMISTVPDNLMYSMAADRNLPAALEDRSTRQLFFRSSRLDLQRPIVDKLVSGVYTRYRNLTPTISTSLSQSTLAGATSMKLGSVTGITAGDWVWIDPNESTTIQGSEVKYVSAVDVASNTLTFGVPPVATYGITGTVAALERAHFAGDTVVRIQILSSLYDVSTNTETMIGGVYSSTSQDQLVTLPENDPFISKKFEVRFRMLGTTTSPVSAEIREWAIRYIYLPEAKKRWRMSFNLRQGIERLDHSPESRDSQTMKDQIWEAKGARRLVRFYALDGGSYLGRIGQPEFRIEETTDQFNGQKLETMVCSLTFIETDAELVK